MVDCYCFGLRVCMVLSYGGLCAVYLLSLSDLKFVYFSSFYDWLRALLLGWCLRCCYGSFRCFEFWKLRVNVSLVV